MRVVVLGASGQLGHEVCDVFEEAGNVVLPRDHADVELADRDAVDALLCADHPDLVINTAAMHQVDDCEQAAGRAFEVNAIGARHVARAARACGAGIFHISTDYVFDGRKKEPYTEQDLPSPLNVYGNSKLAGEYFVLAEHPGATVLRVSGLYGRYPCRAKGLNFVDLMLKLGRERDEVRVVNHEVVTPTSTLEVARQLLALSRDPAPGRCHATAEGACSWYEFAAEIFRQSGISVRLSPADPSEFPVKTPRPFYSVLENVVLKQRGVHVFKNWQDGLREYLSGISSGGAA